MTHPYAVQDHRPPRLIYPDDGREEIIIAIEIDLPNEITTTISPRYQNLEREMAQFMPDVQSIEHVDLQSALEITYQNDTNVVIAGHMGVKCLCLIFDRRGNGIPSELELIHGLNRRVTE